MAPSNRRSKGLVLIFMMGSLSLGGCHTSDWRAATHSLTHRFRNLTSPVLATVGNQPITLEDLREFAGRLPPTTLQWRVTPQGRRMLLQSLIRRRILLSAAIQSGWRLKPFASSSDEDQLLGQFQKQLLSTELAVTDGEAAVFYLRHPEHFQIHGTKPLPLNAVKNDIKMHLATEKYSRWVQTFGSRIKITITDEALESQQL